MKYVNSCSPHVKGAMTTRRIMIDVCIALWPSLVVGCILLGVRSLLVVSIAVLSAALSEIVYRLCCKVQLKQILAEFDFSSIVTGLIVGMNMYPNSAWYAPLLASVFAVVVVKMLFGGTGKNIVNPAVAGRIFAFISFGAAFGGSYAANQVYVSQLTGKSCWQLVAEGASGGVKIGATPLQAILGGTATNELSGWDLFLGTGVYGAIGEVCKLALIVGGIYLVIRGVLNFRWPLVYVAVAGVTAVIIEWITKGSFNQAIETFLPNILSGGLIFGAIFMATDYVTTPATKLGNYVYFVILGILTSVLRYATKGEVVSFVILLMNLVVPLIDMYVVRKPFGYTKPQKEAK